MLRRRLPPVTRVALAFAVGAALPQYGVTISGWALLPIAALLLPAGPFHRPAPPRSHGGLSAQLRFLAAALLVGALHGHVAATRQATDCRWARVPGSVALVADVVRSDGPGSIRVHPVGGCTGELRVRLPGRGVDGASASPGGRVHLFGRWRPGRRYEPGVDPVWSGVVTADSVASQGPAPGLRARLDRHRDQLALLLRERFAREGALAQALVVARKGELDEATRDAFVRAGTAHLLAISGFHVGLLALLVIWVVGRAAPQRVATAVGTALAWGYVALLGFPDAATRAALLLSLVTAGRLLGRPVLAAGALGSALLLLAAVDPGLAGRVGAQLSFAGALGLAVGAAPACRWLTEVAERRFAVARSPRAKGLIDAFGAAVVATAATLPLVAWHFERISLVSVPATLVATPLVALALPAVVATVVLDLLALPGTDVAAAAVATAAEGLLGAARLVVGLFAAPSWSSLDVSRGGVVAAAAGGAVGALLTRGVLRVGNAARVGALAMGAAAGVALAPALNGGGDGRLYLHVLDAGQGDALALRTPGGRWVVVDAGPPPGERVVRAMARLGVRRVDLLLLSHPDADHVGGLAPLVERLEVSRIVGPGTLRATGPWRSAVEIADRRGVPWGIVGRGDAWTLDGVAFRVLHPERGAGPVGSGDPNARSVILHVSWRGVDLLLTGDAPLGVEEGIATAAGDVEILKVGHHGSRTSTSSRFLDRVAPEVALIPVGRGNRYGHPHPIVVRRLRDAGVETWRTDLHGALTVVVDRTGEWWVEASGEAASADR